MDRNLLESLREHAGLAPGSMILAELAGPTVSLNAEATIYPASIIKVPLVAAALQLIDEGTLALDQTVCISERNMTTNDAESPLVPGYATNVRDLCERAIERSDNVATNELFDLIGRERATLLAQTLGLRTTCFARKLSGSDPLIIDDEWDGSSRNAHPASDAAALLSAIAHQRAPWEIALYTMLSRQVWNDKLSRGLRSGDIFAHKTGDTSEVTHDCGILTTQEGRVYVIVVYAALPSNEDNNARFGAFMQALRPHI